MPSTAVDLDPDALRKRFVFRPEINLLYDKEFGLEHRLNATAAVFVGHTFNSSDPALSIANELKLPVSFAQTELLAFWRSTISAPERSRPRRKSGAPADWAAIDLIFPLVLEVELTKVCNWHCDFCYNVWKVPDDYGRRARSVTAGTDPSLHLPFDRVRQVLDEAARGGCLRIRLSGGEPTLHPRFRQVIEYAAGYGFDLELFTNGTRIDRVMAVFLAEHGVRVLLVSVHGLPKTHNRMVLNPAAFDHAMAAVRAGVAAGMTVMPECLVSEDNIAEVPELVSLLAAEGVEHVSFMPYVAYGPLDPRRPVELRAVQELIADCTARTSGTVDFRVPCAPRHCLETAPTPITVRVAENFDDHCAAGVLWGSVSYDGKLRHCPHSSVYAGTVEEGIGPVWRERIVPTVRAALQADNPACGSCGQFAACQGGCHLGKVRVYPGGQRRGLPLIQVRGR